MHSNETVTHNHLDSIIMFPSSKRYHEQTVSLPGAALTTTFGYIDALVALKKRLKAGDITVESARVQVNMIQQSKRFYSVKGLYS